MEDRHVTLSEIAPGVFYSAVFDGHGGPKTAEFAQQHLQTMIRNRDSLTASRPNHKNPQFASNFVSQNGCKKCTVIFGQK